MFKSGSLPALLTLGVFFTSGVSSKCVPMQWEAFIAGTSSQVQEGKLQVYAFAGRYAADYKRNADWLSELVYEDDKLIANYTMLRNENVSYFVDVLNKRCYPLPPGKVKQLCTDSAELKYLISWTLGDQMTDTYAYNTEDRKGSMTYLRDTFIPIGQSFQQEISGVHQQISLQFGNLTATIPDPSVFDIPSFCSKRN